VTYDPQTRSVIGLAEAAHKLAVPYQDAHRLLLTGKLRGEKRGGRWFVVAADVESLIRERSAAATTRTRAERNAI